MARELLAYQEGRRWCDVTSADINAYVKELIGGDCSAKDFRTWHATVLAAVILAESEAESPARTKTARKPARCAAAMVEVSEYLGNTPTIARKSYVDPRVIDLFEDGTTIRSTLARIATAGGPEAPATVPTADHSELPDTHGLIERAVLRMLQNAPDRCPPEPASVSDCRAVRSAHHCAATTPSRWPGWTQQLDALGVTLLARRPSIEGAAVGDRAAGRDLDEGVCGSRSRAPGPRFEVGLYELLHRIAPAHVLEPLAIDVDRAWIVLPDGGPLLADQSDEHGLPTQLAVASSPSTPNCSST